MTQKYKFGLILLSLILLSACSTKPVIVTEYRKVVTPEALLLDCRKPIPNIKTNRDLAELALEALDSIDACNQQLKAAREWNEPQP